MRVEQLPAGFVIGFRPFAARRAPVGTGRRGERRLEGVRRHFGPDYIGGIRKILRLSGEYSCGYVGDAYAGAGCGVRVNDRVLVGTGRNHHEDEQGSKRGKYRVEDRTF